jgi:glycosyltransferase involved in cell wall biosynthesis
MRIQFIISYYWPHISGLTLSLKQLAEDLAALGHDVRVLAGRHTESLAEAEVVNSVSVERVTPLLKLGKAMLMPSLLARAWRAAGSAEVVCLWLPQFDAGAVALCAWIRGRPVIATYVCSLTVPGKTGWIVEYAFAASHLLAGLLAHRIVTLSADYAAQSRFCRIFRSKLAYIDLPVPNAPAADRVYSEPKPPYRIGFVGRLSREKGLVTLLRAGVALKRRWPQQFSIRLCGPAERPIREAEKAEWDQLIGNLGDHVQFVGPLLGDDLDQFLRSIDVLVLPSTDRIEAFGLVQVEAMLRGVPCVASDRPGMRQPILRTGFGLTFEPGRSDDLARAIVDVMAGRFPARPAPADIRAEFSNGRVSAAYLELFTKAISC